MDTFQKRLKHAFERKGINIPKLASKIKYTKSALYHLTNEDMKPNPSMDLIILLCEELEVTPDWLLFGKEPAQVGDVELLSENELLKKEVAALKNLNAILEQKLDKVNSAKKPNAVRKNRVGAEKTKYAANLQQGGLFIAS